MPDKHVLVANYTEPPSGDTPREFGAHANDPEGAKDANGNTQQVHVYPSTDAPSGDTPRKIGARANSGSKHYRAYPYTTVGMESVRQARFRLPAVVVDDGCTCQGVKSFKWLRLTISVASNADLPGVFTANSAYVNGWPLAYLKAPYYNPPVSENFIHHHFKSYSSTVTYWIPLDFAGSGACYTGIYPQAPLWYLGGAGWWTASPVRFEGETFFSGELKIYTSYPHWTFVMGEQEPGGQVVPLPDEMSARYCDYIYEKTWPLLDYMNIRFANDNKLLVSAGLYPWYCTQWEGAAVTCDGWMPIEWTDEHVGDCPDSTFTLTKSGMIDARVNEEWAGSNAFQGRSWNEEWNQWDSGYITNNVRGVFNRAGSAYQVTMYGELHEDAPGNIVNFAYPPWMDIENVSAKDVLGVFWAFPGFYGVCNAHLGHARCLTDQRNHYKDFCMINGSQWCETDTYGGQNCPTGSM